MDRSIPHIRDIFAPASRKKSGEFQDLCVYDRSPRSRRKAVKTFEIPPDYEQEDKKITCSPRKRNEKGKENTHKSSDEARLLPDKTTAISNNNNNKSYSSKTLTERDIRHLERHLSMKKTIRKQISRNLAQAFVDNPGLFEPGPKQDYAATMSKAKLAKSEQNVLDMLKVSISDRDSGHCSPTNDDEDNDDLDDRKAYAGGHRNSEAKLLTKEPIETKGHSSEKKSIWKMFSSRSKGKR